MQERRKDIRYSPSLQVGYVYVRGMVALEEGTQLSDLSANGMRLYLSSIIKTGDIFLVEMPLPFIGTISAIAKVIWTRNIEKNKSIEAGVAFDWVSNANRLGRYIEGLRVKAA